MGKGMKDKGQGQDFHTLAKPLTLGEDNISNSGFSPYTQLYQGSLSS